MIVKFKPDVIIHDEGTRKFSIDKADIRSNSIKELNKKYKIQNARSFTKKERKFKKIRSGKIRELPDMSQLYLLEFPGEFDVTSVVEEYKRDPSVEYASPNYLRGLFTPNDEYYTNNLNDKNQWGLYKIWLTPTEEGISGWNKTTGSSEVKVAVIDTGVNYIHIDLKDRVNTLEGWNYIANNNNPLDDYGHGSHVSGIIGAETNNGSGIAGVDWNCRIIPLKVFDSGGNPAPDSAFIDAIIRAIDVASADVINMSFGQTYDNPALRDIIINYAATADCVLVASAGNSNNQTPNYPAAYDPVIAVAATDPNDHKASYSNYGTWVDVSAPGGDNGPGYKYYLQWILSTYIPGNTYAWLQGTSMAAPYVSGLAALLWAYYPTATAEEISQRIINYSDNIDAYNPGYAGKLGKGRINAFMALGGLYGYISHPADGGIAYGVVNVIGSATGEGFVNYRVESIKSGDTQWTTLETVYPPNVPVLDTVLATIDTTGLDTNITVKIRLNDLATTEKSVTFHTGSVDPPIIKSRVEYGPNPFNPEKGNIMIKYTLSANTDTYIYIFDITGTLICRKSYPYGVPGGNQGVNRVYWDGKNDYGEIVANGVYPFKVATEGRTIGSGRIAVLK